MRLLLLTTEFPPGPGGIGTHAFQVARQLTRLGWDITVFAAQDYAAEDEIAAFTAAQPFRVIRWASQRGTLANFADRWRLVNSHLRGWQPDAALASGSRSVWLMSGLAARHPGLRWAAVGHGTEFQLARWWERALTRWAFRRADAVICVSEFTRRRMRQAGIQPRVEVVIPNGADPGLFKVLPGECVAHVKEQLGLQGAHLLVTVGNVTQRKGQDIVIRALPEILKQAPNTHYLIVGLPTLQQAYEALARELGVAEHVRFLGRVDAKTLVEVLNAADVFVMTSRHTETGDFEGYGIAVVEAALCGKPAVVSDNSGLVEAVGVGRTGLAVPQDDPAATARAVLVLLTDPGKRARMGEAARARALSEQTWEMRAAEYDRVLRGIVAT